MFVPARRRPGAGPADRRQTGLRPAGVAGPAAADGPARRAAVPSHRAAAVGRSDPPYSCRIGALFDGHIPAPAGLLAVDPAKLREAALSWRKIGTLRDVAERLSGGRLDQAALSELLTIAGQVVAGTSFDPDRRMLLAGCPRGRPMGGRIPVYRRVGDVIRIRPGKADRGIRTSCLRMPSRTLPPATAQVDDLCAYPPRLPQLHHPRVIDLAPSPGDGVAVLPARARLLCRAACTSGLAVDHQCRPDPPRSPTQGAGSAASGCAG